MTPTKFTQEIKDNWLANLRSGKYKQGFVTLHNKTDNTYCVLGVLMVFANIPDPYSFISETLGEKTLNHIYGTNDKRRYRFFFFLSRDYSNVIPLIEKLPTQE